MISFKMVSNGNQVSGLDFSKEQLKVAASRQQLLSKSCYKNRVSTGKSTEPVTAFVQEWMIDNVVVPVATGYGLEEEYKYLKSSIREFLTGEELEKLGSEVGFSKARHYEIGGGIMGNLVATRLVYAFHLCI